MPDASADIQQLVGQRRPFRWRIVPAASCWIFGGFYVVVSLVHLVFVVVGYFAIGQHGGYANIAQDFYPSTVRLLTILIGFLGGCAGVAAGNAWIRQQRRSAIVLSVIVFSSSGVAANLSLRLSNSQKSKASISEPSRFKTWIAGEVLDERTRIEREY